MTLIITKCPEIWLCYVTICTVNSYYFIIWELVSWQHISDFLLTLKYREGAFHGRKKVSFVSRALSIADCHVMGQFVSHRCPKAHVWTGHTSSSEMRAFLRWSSCYSVCWRVFTALNVSQFWNEFRSIWNTKKNISIVYGILIPGPLY